MKQGLYRKVTVFSLIFSLLLPIAAGNIVSAVNTNLDSTEPKANEVSAEAPAFDTFEPLETESVAEVASNSEDFADAVNLSAGQTVTVSITTAYEKEYYKFTPTATGFYMLQSSNNTGDPAVWLYNASQVQIAVNDDCYMDIFEDEVEQHDNFGITYYFVKDVTYYIAAGEHASSTGTYRLTLTPYVSAVALDVSTATLGTGYSVNINAAYAVKYYKFVAPVAGSYIFKSFQEVGDARILIYNSNLSLVAQDDNSGGNGKFYLEVNASASTIYYIVVGHTGAATGTYGFAPLMEIADVSGINHLENIGTGQHLDIHGPVEQELAHQWYLHTGAQQRWEFDEQEEENDGYYTIRSQYGNKRYLAISSTSNGVNNVVLRSSVTDYALWKIYGNSSGELLIEPKSAPGKVLCVPNMSQGTELQLCWMHSSAYSRNKWQISVQWDVPLEGQEMSLWCWAASARMFAGTIANIPDTRGQEEAVVAVKGSSKNDGGTNEQAMRATRYYISGNQWDGSQEYTFTTIGIFAEATLRRFLDEGYTVFISREHFTPEGVFISAHASVIGGYTTCVVNNTLAHQFIVFDPWPADDSYSWPNTPQPTTGHIYTASYDWLCTADSVLPDDPDDDNTEWRSFLTQKTTYSEDIIAPG